MSFKENLTYEKLFRINEPYTFKTELCIYIDSLKLKKQHENVDLGLYNYKKANVLLKHLYEKNINYKKCIYPDEPLNYLINNYLLDNYISNMPMQNILDNDLINEIINYHCISIYYGNYNSCKMIIYLYIDLLKDLTFAIKLCEEFTYYLTHLTICNFSKEFEKIVALNDISNMYKYIIRLKCKTYDINNNSNWLIYQY